MSTAEWLRVYGVDRELELRCHIRAKLQVLIAKTEGKAQASAETAKEDASAAVRFAPHDWFNGFYKGRMSKGEDKSETLYEILRELKELQKDLLAVLGG